MLKIMRKQIRTNNPKIVGVNHISRGIFENRN